MCLLLVLHARHADRTVKDVDHRQAVLLEPAKDFRVEVFRLMRRRVPVERVKPSPAPLRLHGDRQRHAEQPSHDGDAIQPVQRNRHRAQHPRHPQRETSRDETKGIRHAMRRPVSRIDIDRELAAWCDGACHARQRPPADQACDAGRRSNRRDRTCCRGTVTRIRRPGRDARCRDCRYCGTWHRSPS